MSVDLNARKQMPLFHMGSVQKLTGLTARQIRYYEEHGLIHPSRTEGNQRLFSFVDVEQLLEIRRLLDKGLNMVGVKEHFLQSDSSGVQKKQTEPTDRDVYAMLRRQMVGQPKVTSSEFQGDMYRFYPKK